MIEGCLTRGNEDRAWYRPVSLWKLHVTVSSDLEIFSAGCPQPTCGMSIVTRPGMWSAPRMHLANLATS